MYPLPWVMWCGASAIVHEEVRLKIYRFARGRPTDAFWDLTPEEQAESSAKEEEAREKVGGKLLVMGTQYWADEHWLLCNVIEFPSIEAAMEYSRLLWEAGTKGWEGESWLAKELPSQT